MELKIKISERIYDEITKEGQISLSDLHELFDAVHNGISADEADNVTEQAEEKDKANNKPESEKEFNDNAEICRLMEAYMGRGLDEHEIQILSLYKTVENEKEMLAGLSGMDRILMKIMIRSLVS